MEACEKERERFSAQKVFVEMTERVLLVGEDLIMSGREGVWVCWVCRLEGPGQIGRAHV